MIGRRKNASKENTSRVSNSDLKEFFLNFQYYRETVKELFYDPQSDLNSADNNISVNNNFRSASYKSRFTNAHENDIVEMARDTTPKPPQLSQLAQNLQHLPTPILSMASSGQGLDSYGILKGPDAILKINYAQARHTKLFDSAAVCVNPINCICKSIKDKFTIKPSNAEDNLLTCYHCGVKEHKT